MTTATKSGARKSAPRKAARARGAEAPAINGDAPVSAPNGAPNGHNGDEPYEPPTQVGIPVEIPAPMPPPVVESHPVYGAAKVYRYQPEDGSEPIDFPHISTCRPTPLFFYDNRHKDEMRQAFAWMDLCSVPDRIGRRLFLLPDHEQAKLLREWFSGLQLTPQEGVSPPGES